jgi:hypothetical protein
MILEIRISEIITTKPASSPRKKRLSNSSLAVAGKAEKREAGIKSERRRLTRFLFVSADMSLRRPKK